MHRVRKMPDGCWLWLGGKDKKTGYGTSWLDGTYQKSHCVFYQLVVGPIPEGLELHHSCFHTSCVNTSHLRPVTHKENRLLSKKRLIDKACKRGHTWTPTNTRINSRGQRTCRECNRENARAWNERHPGVHNERCRESYRRERLEAELAGLNETVAAPTYQPPWLRK
jgi:hypothetical protein